MNLMEAFTALDKLNEDIFTVDAEGIKKLQDFVQNDDTVDELDVFNLNAEPDEDIDANECHIGDAILDCCACHSKVFKPVAEIIVDEESQLANVGDECPYCYSVEGYKVVGEVTPVDNDEDVVEINDEDAIEVEDSAEQIDEDIDEVNISTDDVDIEIEDKDDEVEEVAEESEEIIDESVCSNLKEDWNKGVLISMNLPLSEVEKAANESKISIPAYSDGEWNSTTSLRVYGFPDSYGMVDKDKGIFELKTNFYDSDIKEFGTLRDFNKAVRENDLSLFGDAVLNYTKQIKDSLVKKGISVQDTTIELKTGNQSTRKSVNESVDLLTKENTIASLLKDNMSELASIIDVNELRERIIELVDNSDIAGKPAAQKLKRDLYSKKSAGALLSTIATYMTGEKVVKTGRYKKAVNNDEYSSLLGESKSLNEPNHHEILDWLSEHEQAYEDAEIFFEETPLYDVSKDDLLSWIQDHELLWDDFKTFFNIENLGDDDEYSSLLGESKSIEEGLFGKKKNNKSSNTFKVVYGQNEFTVKRGFRNKDDAHRWIEDNYEPADYSKYKVVQESYKRKSIKESARIPSEYSKYFMVDDYEPDEGEYKVGDKVNGVEILAYTIPKARYEDIIDEWPFLLKDRNGKVFLGNIIKDRIYPFELSDYINESFKRNKLRESEENEEKTIGDKLKKYQMWVDYDMEHYGKVSETTQKIIDKAGLQLIKDQYGDYEVSVGRYRAESVVAGPVEQQCEHRLKEDINSIEINSDDLSIEIDKSCDKCNKDQVVAPVDEETKAEIEFDVNDIDEDAIEDAVEECLTESFSNVKFFKCSNLTSRKNRIIVEGIVGFKSGKKRNTNFVFRPSLLNESKIVFRGFNRDLKESVKSISLNCKKQGNKIIVESCKVSK